MDVFINDCDRGSLPFENIEVYMPPACHDTPLDWDYSDLWGSPGMFFPDTYNDAKLSSFHAAQEVYNPLNCMEASTNNPARLIMASTLENKSCTKCGIDFSGGVGVVITGLVLFLGSILASLTLFL